jgi:hypothetical protein
MDNTEKKIVGVFSFLPILSWLATIVYFLFINKDLIAAQSFQDHNSVTTNIINHFLPFTIMLSFAELITGIMIIYYVVHIARLKTFDSFTKLLLIIFLVFTGPIAVMVVWFTVIKKETKQEPMYPDLTAVPNG